MAKYACYDHVLHGALELLNMSAVTHKEHSKSLKAISQHDCSQQAMNFEIFIPKCGTNKLRSK